MDFDELDLDASADSIDTVISFEQANPQNFKCVTFFRPLFWLMYYLFCCCLFPSCYAHTERAEDRNIIASFQRTLKTLKKKRFPDSEVFNALVQLYRCKANAFTQLSRVRLNPSTLSINVRTDLEFFIPQLCSFYLSPGVSNAAEA